MRHATQDRFDRVARGELERPAYTLAQMSNWTETDWNWHMRQAIHACGYDVFHIREASETGVADLIAYRVETARVSIDGDKVIDEQVQVISAWLELKVENDKVAYMKDARRAGQRQFMRYHWETGHNAMYIMFDRKMGMLAVHQGDLRGRVKMLPASPYSVDWLAVFAHFKARC